MSEWIKWNGWTETLPIPTDKNVDVILEDGGVIYNESPTNLRWTRTGAGGDITLWRVHDEREYGYKVPESEAQQGLKDRFSESPGVPLGQLNPNIDLEESIMRCWAVVEEIQDVYELTEHEDMNQIQNALLGLKELTDHKFQKLWRAFEESLKG